MNLLQLQLRVVLVIFRLNLFFFKYCFTLNLTNTILIWVAACHPKVFVGPNGKQVKTIDLD